MQLNPSEISELIRAKIQNLPSSTEVRTTGTVVSVTDGIVPRPRPRRCDAGRNAQFPATPSVSPMNLERDSVGAVVLGEYEHILEGDEVKTTGRILEVPVGRTGGPRGERWASRSTARSAEPQAVLAD